MTERSRPAGQDHRVATKRSDVSGNQDLQTRGRMCTDNEDPPDDEVDIDLEEPGATQQEEIEYLGDFESLEAYFQSQLEDLMSRSIQPWIFECIDWQQVQREMEGTRWRYVLQGSGVYRTGIPTPPDPVGPWIPTREE